MLRCLAKKKTYLVHFKLEDGHIGLNSVYFLLWWFVVEDQKRINLE